MSRCRSAVHNARAGAGLLALTAACHSPVAERASAPPKLTALVTPAVAKHLTADGHLIPPDPISLNGDSIISPSRAHQLAEAYLHTYGPIWRHAWEEDRGKRLDLAELAVAPRIYYAQSPYGPVPPGFHPAVRTLHGPYYVVCITERSTLVVLMAVSALNTGVTVDSTGRIHLPPHHGNEFIHVGVPTRFDGQVPVTAEEAVVRVATATGQMVSSVPELVLQNRRVMPIFALWKVAISHPVTVTRMGAGPDQGRRTVTDTVFVPFASDPRTLHVPQATSVVASEGSGLTFDAVGRVGPPKTFHVAVHPGYAVAYDSARILESPPTAPVQPRPVKPRGVETAAAAARPAHQTAAALPPR